MSAPSRKPRNLINAAMLLNLVVQLLSDLEHEDDDQINRKVQEQISRLGKKLEEYRRIGDLWQSLNEGVNKHRDNFAKYATSDICETALHFGLAQFSFTVRDIEQVTEYANRLFSGNSFKKREAVAKITNDCFLLIESDYKVKPNLAPITAILWMIRNSEWLCELTPNYKDHRFSIAVARARALIAKLQRLKHAVAVSAYSQVAAYKAEVEEIIVYLNELQSKSTADERAQLLLASAHIEFHLWLTQGLSSS